MSLVKKIIVCTKFISPFKGCRKNNDVAHNLSSMLSVNEEYKEAFRTTSYIEILSKVQGQLSKASISRVSSSSSSMPLCMHLSESLLEPRQETLMRMTENLDLHHLLVDFFKASLESCDICELLLGGVHQTRKTYKKMKRVIKITRRLQNGTLDNSDEIYKAVFKELAAFTMLKNPLSIISRVQFREVHDSSTALLQMLNSESKRIRRKVRCHKLLKKARACSLVISHSAIVAALLVIALHSVVGIVAAPGLMACSFGLLKRKGAGKEGKGLRMSMLERLGLQLDVAAKGMYILIKDIDTVSRLVSRLQDEMDHWKTMAQMCIRNGRNEILKEIVNEFSTHQMCFLEQLEELEQHIYLCFLTINRSRRDVLQEIMVNENES